MTGKALREVLEALGADGIEVRFVGGCVRDSLAGRPVKDVDLATPDPPDRVSAKLAAAKIKAVPTGVAHGTVTAVSRGKAFEVTTLRRDLATDGRHATVGFTDDWLADAARRDLTINAMSLTPQGRLFDPFGGAADLAAGRIRFVGRAEERIREDHLRLLRFFRFYAHYGRGLPDAEAIAAARALAPHLCGLSAERLRQELLHILTAATPWPALQAMESTGVLAVLLPETEGLERLRALLALEARLRAPPEPLCRLAALISWDKDGVATLAGRLRFSNRERAALETMTEMAASWPSSPDGAELDGLLHRMGVETVKPTLLIYWADAAHRGQAPTTAEEDARWTQVTTWQAKDFPLTGHDLLAEGVAAGPEMGEMLKDLEAWWLSKARRPDRDACLAEARRRRLR